jgi:hypothetical protein
MGVFPLADTMSFSSNHPLSCGGETHAPVSGLTEKVWWYPHPTTNPGRNAAAANSPIHYIASHAITRCPGTDPSSRIASAGRYIRRAPTVRTSRRTVGWAAERGPPSATSRMPTFPTIRHAARHSSPVAATAVPVFAAGGNRMQ